MRGHYRAPVQGSGGALQAGAVISVYVNGTTTPPSGAGTLLPGPIYADGSSLATLSNPFTTLDGNISFYLAAPQRVDLGIQPPAGQLVIFPDIDVNQAVVSSIQLTFPGSGASSTAVGNSATATQPQAVALGDTATATGQQATAVGQQANASGTFTTAVGQQASATSTGATAVGQNTAAQGASSTALGSGAIAAGQSGTALGAGAAAPAQGATAVGAGAQATVANQVVLGTAAGTVAIPGALSGPLSASVTAPPGNAFQQALMASHNPALIPWWTAVANRAFARANVVCLGDSITEGQGATAFDSRFVGRLRDRLRGQFQTGVGAGLTPPPFASGQFLAPPKVYAPAAQTTAVVSTTTMAAFSSANINTGSFIVPPSGAVVVDVSFIGTASSATSFIAFGLAAHGTVTPLLGQEILAQAATVNPQVYDLNFYVSGLTPGTTVNLDLVGCVTTATTFTITAFGQTTVTPTLGAAGVGAPVVTTVQAVGIPGTGGRGFIGTITAGVVSFTWPTTIAGTPASGATLGPKSQFTQLNATGQSVTYNLVGDSADIFWTGVPFGGTFSWAVDGGAATNIVTNISPLTDGEVTHISLGTMGAHTLVLAWVSGNSDVTGVVEYSGDFSSGIHVHDAGHYGWATGDWVTTLQSGALAGPAAAIAALKPNLIIITLGVNDQFNGVVPATFQANLQTIITGLKAQLTAPFPSFILNMMPPRTGQGGYAFPWSQYVAAAYTVANADSSGVGGTSIVTVMDFTLGAPRLYGADTDVYGTWHVADLVHPSNEGHQAIADYLAEFLIEG